MTIDEGYQKFLETEGALLVDVREDYEFAQGSIPHAHNVPLSSIASIQNLVSDVQQPLFVFCRSGMRAKKAKEKLVEMGYCQVYDIGGITAYTGELTTRP